MHLKRFNDEKGAKAIQEHDTCYDPRPISREDTDTTEACDNNLTRL